VLASDHVVYLFVASISTKLALLRERSPTNRRDNETRSLICTKNQSFRSFDSPCSVRTNSIDRISGCALAASRMLHRLCFVKKIRILFKIGDQSRGPVGRPCVLNRSWVALLRPRSRPANAASQSKIGWSLFRSRTESRAPFRPRRDNLLQCSRIGTPLRGHCVDTLAPVRIFASPGAS